MAEPMAGEPLVAVVGVSKRFTGTQALDDVSFTLASGEVHALIGENGAGKSTLIKGHGGVHSSDIGTISLAGAPFAFSSPSAALAAGLVSGGTEAAVSHSPMYRYPGEATRQLLGASAPVPDGSRTESYVNPVTG